MSFCSFLKYTIVSSEIFHKSDSHRLNNIMSWFSAVWFLKCKLWLSLLYLIFFEILRLLIKCFWGTLRLMVFFCQKKKKDWWFYVIPRYVAIYFFILLMRYKSGIVTNEMLAFPKSPFIIIGFLEALGLVAGMYAGGMRIATHDWIISIMLKLP